MNNEWLALTTEEALNPDRPICDPHHHLWDYPGSRYLLEELTADTRSGHNIVSTIYMECGSAYRRDGEASLRPVGETEFVEKIARRSANSPTKVAAAIIGFADLTLGEAVQPVLEAHLAASPHRFRGIRHAGGWHQDAAIRNSHTNPGPRLFMNEQFRAGMAVLDRMGLSFDGWFYHHQMKEFVDLAKAFPNVTMILDHFGGPLGIGPYRNQTERVFKEWQEDIAGLKDCPNVYFKLGGINMKINGYGWHKRDRPPGSAELAEKTAPWYHHCIELFGPERCMFESNFPVDGDSCSYNVLWNAFKRMAADYDESAKANLFQDTARRVYRCR